MPVSQNKGISGQNLPLQIIVPDQYLYKFADGQRAVGQQLSGGVPRVGCEPSFTVATVKGEQENKFNFFNLCILNKLFHNITFAKRVYISLSFLLLIGIVSIVIVCMVPKCTLFLSRCPDFVSSKTNKKNSDAQLSSLSQSHKDVLNTEPSDAFSASGSIFHPVLQRMPLASIENQDFLGKTLINNEDELKWNSQEDYSDDISEHITFVEPGAGISAIEKYIHEKQSDMLRVDSRTEGIVLPTIPTSTDEKSVLSTTNEQEIDVKLCRSTSISLCRGVLGYDLTPSTISRFPLSIEEMKAYESLFESNCSARARELICSILEPECHPKTVGVLEPCRRFCKAIREPCSALINEFDVLVDVFDCDKYPDSNNDITCEDPTRRKNCRKDEFKCSDLSCIPMHWECDNIKDCIGGEDEANCVICDSNQFRCHSKKECILSQFKCNAVNDCADGSDELNCTTSGRELSSPNAPDIISFTNILFLNDSNENLFSADSTADRLALGSEFHEANSTSIKNVTCNRVTQGDLENSRTIKFETEVGQESILGNKTPNAVNNDPKQKCIDDQLRCVDGKCITVGQICDRVADCTGGEDELMCNYDT